MALICDTGPLYAALDRRDKDHQRCAEHRMQATSTAPLGFVDASVVAIAERLSERRVASIDHRHFGTVRPAHVASLELVPTF